MTGPEHYREAELLLDTTDETHPQRASRLRMAQVHATLAQVAAAADLLRLYGPALNAPITAAWQEVLS